MANIGYRIGDLTETTTVADADNIEISRAGSAGSFKIQIVSLLKSVLPNAGRIVATLAAFLANNSDFNVRDYGATGDGVTDDTVALQNTIAAAAAVATNGIAGGVVKVPPGTYKFTAQLVVPASVRIVGAGLQSTELVWAGASGFGVKLGNNATVLSYGITLENIAVIVQNAAAHAVLLYGVIDCHLSNVYIEGVPGTTATIGVQIDGADVSAFFIIMTNVHCNHVFKGFVHTSSGTVQPTQVTGINCVAFCNNTAGSIGIDIQTVGALACGDGVTYVGGDMESCTTGVRLDAGGSSIHGMRFENTQGVATDILFTANAKNNAIFGATSAFTVTDSSGDPTNQWFGVSKSVASGTAQPNKQNDTAFSTPTATRATLLSSGANNEGAIGIQNGAIGANDGGAIWIYGGAHATKPNHVSVAIGAGGKFRVNGSGLDNGTDWLTVDRSTGFTTLANASVTGSLRHAGTTLCFYGASPISKPTISGSRAGNAALASLLSQLSALGLITDSTTA